MASSQRPISARLAARSQIKKSLIEVKKRDVSNTYINLRLAQISSFGNHCHSEPVELRWVAVSAGQGSILEAVIHGW